MLSGPWLPLRRSCTCSARRDVCPKGKLLTMHAESHAIHGIPHGHEARSGVEPPPCLAGIDEMNTPFIKPIGGHDVHVRRPLGPITGIIPGTPVTAFTTHPSPTITGRPGCSSASSRSRVRWKARFVTPNWVSPAKSGPVYTRSLWYCSMYREYCRDSPCADSCAEAPPFDAKSTYVLTVH